MPEARSSAVRPRVLMVVGTRPEAIKMAPVAQALAERRDTLESRLVLTGQHDQLVGQVLEAFHLVPELGLLPDVDLGVMREGQDLYHLSQACLRGLREVFRDYRPHLVLVQGDTATVFLASLVAFFERAGVGHVEAGLRSGSKWAPYPEEMFRRLSDVLADFHFAPTPRARENLLAEGVPPEGIHVTGNTVVDALMAVARLPRVPGNPQLRKVVEGGRKMVLLTAHRRESFGEPLEEVFRAVRELADREEEVEILYPVHPNPLVREPARELLSDHPRIHLTDPLDYLDLVSALEKAVLVLTDSGGIQEEAPTFGTPVLVLREVTERPEGVDAGVAILVGTDGKKILETSLSLLRASSGGGKGFPGMRNPYGDGRAGERIADILASELAGIPRVTRNWDGV
jgi:UDP-N-acetylglucosamine 2-epimerase (non-hydrolysing)